MKKIFDDITGHILSNSAKSRVVKCEFRKFNYKPTETNTTLKLWYKPTETNTTLKLWYEERCFNNENINVKDVRNKDPKYEIELTFDELLKLIEFIKKSHPDILNVNNNEWNNIEPKSLINLPDILKSVKGIERESLLNKINKYLSPIDLKILEGRKEGLKEFDEKLKNVMNDGREKVKSEEWINFFKKNAWIFGYSLDYKFFDILNTKVDQNRVIIGDHNFTAFVMLESPNAPLLSPKQYRTNIWGVSEVLLNAVSTILEKKFETVTSSTFLSGDKFDDEGYPIRQKTYNQKVILIIGTLKNIGSDKETAVEKLKIFELFRRDLKNIEIFTYDELYDRAKSLISDL